MAAVGLEPPPDLPGISADPDGRAAPRAAPAVDSAKLARLRAELDQLSPADRVRVLAELV